MAKKSLIICSLAALALQSTTVFAEGFHIQRAERMIERCPNGVEKLPMPDWGLYDKKGNPLPAEKRNAGKLKDKIDEYRCPDIKAAKEAAKRQKRSANAAPTT